MINKFGVEINYSKSYTFERISLLNQIVGLKCYNFHLEYLVACKNDVINVTTFHRVLKKVLAEKKSQINCFVR